MTQVEVDEFGNLNIIFNEPDENDVILVAHVDNGAEIEYTEERICKLILPSFEEQLNRGSLLGLEMDITNIYIKDDVLFFELVIQHINSINCRVDISSINSKI